MPATPATTTTVVVTYRFKLCSKCDTKKPITDFSTTKSGAHNAWCFECMRAYNKARRASGVKPVPWPTPDTDPLSLKVCCKCGQSKTRAEFGSNQYHKDKRSGSCLDCTNARHRARRARAKLAKLAALATINPSSESFDPTAYAKHIRSLNQLSAQMGRECEAAVAATVEKFAERKKARVAALKAERKRVRDLAPKPVSSARPQRLGVSPMNKSARP